MTLFTELKRRNVFRVALAYAVMAWLVMQVGEVMGPALLLPSWVQSALAFFLILGFPFALFFAWAFEMTPEGLKREVDVDRSQSITGQTGRSLDRIVIVLLLIAVGYFAWDKFAGAPDEPRSTAQNATTAEPVDTSSSSAGPPEASGDDRESIAVLPFVNMSSDPEQEYFSDGLSEELLNLLAQIPELRVTSRSSAFSFKGKEFRITDVGRELNVDHVLEGSVRKSGTKVRVTAQLIAVDSDAHLWSDTWDRALDDVFVIQDEIAAAVVEALKLQLLDAAPTAKPTDAQGYANYLQALELIGQRTQQSFSRAELLLKDALAMDPDYVPALGLLAGLHIERASAGLEPIREANDRAREILQQAVAIDPDDGRIYANLSDIAMNYDWDWAAGRDYVDRALALNPNDSLTIIQAISLASSTGNVPEALRYARQLVAADPVNANAYAWLGFMAMFSRDYPSAIAAFQRALDLNPGYYGGHYYLGLALMFAGQYEQSLAEIEKEPSDGFRLTGLALVQHSLGNDVQSQQALAKLVSEWAAEGAYQIGMVHAWRNEPDAAFQWLEQAFANHDSGITMILNDETLDGLRADPRMLDLIKRVGLDPARQQTSR